VAARVSIAKRAPLRLRRPDVKAEKPSILARIGAARVPEIMRMDLASPTALG
jgi:hypothetical protein